MGQASWPVFFSSVLRQHFLGAYGLQQERVGAGSGGRLLIRNGKTHGEFPAALENGDSKYTTTSVRFSNGDGKMHVQEIRLGGTNTRLVFSE